MNLVYITNIFYLYAMYQMYVLQGHKDHKDIQLGVFQYENKPDELFQLFEVKPFADKFEYLRIHFFSNHGHENYTCIYR